MAQEERTLPQAHAEFAGALLADYAIRPMAKEDIPEVEALEREAFPTQTPATSFHRELTNRLTGYLVAYHNRPEAGAGPTGSQREILGYAGLWFMVDEAHLTALAVGEAHRRRGIGRRLLMASLKLAIEKKATLMTLEVRVSNREARALYEKFGFKRVGVRRAYYTDNREDAFLMTVESIDATDYRATLEALESGPPPYSNSE